MENIKEKLTEWMTSFVEVPNDKLWGFAPCPYTRAARINNKIKVVECDVFEFVKCIQDSKVFLDEYEVVILVFDHHDSDPVTLQEFVQHKNQDLMQQNYVILEDHPDTPEYVNGIKMNFGYCGLLLLQKLDKLNASSEKLRKQGYYNAWDKFSLDSVVSWRYIHNEIL